MKRALHDLVPPVMLRAARKWRGGIRFVGQYPTWSEARLRASGYDDAAILDRVRKAAALAVESGGEAYERDGTLIYVVDPRFPVLAALLDAALAGHGNLRVVDFGGAMGSTYYQSKRFLGSVTVCRWCVVEQPHYVRVAREEFENEELHFHETVEECAAGGLPSIAVFSGVLQYLESPLDMLTKVARMGISRIFIDRTPFVADDVVTRLTVQRVPRSLGGGSYPAWLFNRDDLLSVLKPAYRMVFEFPAIDGRIGCGRNAAEFKGMYFVRS